MLVHCGSANRVGALLVPCLVLDEGRTTDEALRLAQQVGLRSQELTAAALAYARSHGAWRLTGSHWPSPNANKR